MIFYLYIGAALALDLVFGDPRWFAHPVRLIGWLCTILEAQTRKLAPAVSLRWCGFLAFLAVIAVSAGITIALLGLLSSFSRLAAEWFALIILYFCLAAGDLIHHSKAVHKMLAVGDVALARQEVAKLVGRDTGQLDEAAITRACIESVAENLVDGITAPLFWAVTASLFAPVLAVPPIFAAALGAVSYKAVNTMDSMYGYKNEKYLEFGWFAARFDDVANYLPARISGLCVVAAACLLGYNCRSSLGIFLRDRLQSTSPNSGHTEASFAGALGIRLGGESSYFGTRINKPLIGKELGVPVAFDIIKSNRLVIGATGVFCTLMLCCHGLIHIILP